MAAWIPILVSIVAVSVAIAGFVRTRSTQSRDRLLQVERRRQDCLNRLFALELTHVESLRVLEKVRTPDVLALDADGSHGRLVEGFLADTRALREVMGEIDLSGAPLKAEVLLEQLIGQLTIMETDSKRGMALAAELEKSHGRFARGLSELSAAEKESLFAAIAAERDPKKGALER
jgi:hypothetical protein